MENYIYIVHLPKHSFLFGVLLFAVLATLSVFFPENGWKAGEYAKFNFPSLQELFGLKNKKADISGVLKSIENIDTSFRIEASPVKRTTLDSNRINVASSDTSLPDAFAKVPDESVHVSFKKEAEEPRMLNTAIQKRNSKALYAFFKALSKVKSNQSCLRVLHYGDSQIEGDRMTEYLRLKLQAQFGGEGPGLVSFMPVSRSVINRIEYGNNWERYGAYTARDKRVKHNNFGVLAGFCRFQANSKPEKGFAISSGTLGITTTPLGGGNALNFKKIKLFYGGSKFKTWCEFYEGPVLMKVDSLEANGNFNIRVLNLKGWIALIFMPSH
jgi:hypothetical protein